MVQLDEGNQTLEQRYLQTAYQEEKDKLSEVIEHIKQERDALGRRMPARAAYQETADAIQAVLVGQSDNLYSALDQPYFGRLDYFHRDRSEADPVPVDGETADLPMHPRTIYIGIAHIQCPDGNHVISWTVPVARLWYSQSYEDGYTAPKGYIPTRVDLKRYLRIRRQSLEELNDLFRRQLPAPAAARQNVLAKALSKAGDGEGHLQVIIETIEPEQYENIANVSDKVLIVQGAAGSGKSEIGLHRIAWLLSPHNDIPVRERPTPADTLFIGPSKAFLEYAADILPSLGVQQQVKQITFGDWLNGQQSARPRIGSGVWDNLLDKGELTRFNEKAESFKGSLEMAQSLLRQVRQLAIRVRKDCLNLPALTVRMPGLDDGNGITIQSSQIGEAVRAVFSNLGENYRLNRRRQDFINRITSLVWERRRITLRGYREQPILLRRDLQNDFVAPWCDSAWPTLDFRQEYAAVLSNPERVYKAAKGNLTVEDANALTDSARSMLNNGFQDSDRGGLAYMDHLLNETIAQRYRHIVVDESQDLSPLEFKLIGISSSNNWFTILGDTAQRLTGYRGINRWQELNRIFGKSDIAVQYARTSYRSNSHITRFNNRILRQFDTNLPAPKPFGRDGYRPEYHSHGRAQDMYHYVLEDLSRIRSLDGLENATIAILLRDTGNLNRFQDVLTALGRDDVVRIGQERHSNATTFFARIPYTKGLEYDAVIVLGVNQTFTDTVFNKKLLYLAATRAKHYLGIHWHGQQSPILSSIYSGGVRQFQHR